MILNLIVGLLFNKGTINTTEQMEVAQVMQNTPCLNISLPNKERDPYHNRIYLCTEMSLGTFSCKKFVSFTEALQAYQKLEMPNKSAYIPMCKYTPEIFDKMVLNKKMKDLYVSSITIE